MPSLSEISASITQDTLGVSCSLGDPSLRLPKNEALEKLANLLGPKVHWSVIAPTATYLTRVGKITPSQLTRNRARGQIGFSADDLFKIASLYVLISESGFSNGRTSRRKLHEHLAKLEENGILPK